MIVVIIILVVVAVILIINYNGKKHDEEMRKYADSTKSNTTNPNARLMDIVHSMGDNNNAHYWEGFKRRKPVEANAIVAASGLNMDVLSDKDAFEIVNTFLRWSNNAGTPISQLKENTIAQLSEFLKEASYEMLETKFREEMSKETRTFNISQKHTISHFMLKYLAEAKERQPKASIDSDDIRSLVEELLDTIFTHKMKANMNEDMAYVFGSLVVDMVKSGDVDPQIQMMLPPMTIQNIKMMHALYASGKVNKLEFDNILEESLDNFAHKF